MGIQNWSENVVLVDLAEEPQLGDELTNTIAIFKEKPCSDLVIDFSEVDIITSSSLSKLLKLNKMLNNCSKKLILCSMTPATRGVFTVTGLQEIFEIVDDKFVALASLQLVC